MAYIGAIRGQQINIRVDITGRFEKVGRNWATTSIKEIRCPARVAFVDHPILPSSIPGVKTPRGVPFATSPERDLPEQ